MHVARYTARALFRMLERKYVGQQWPGHVFANVQEWDGKGVGLDHGAAAADGSSSPGGSCGMSGIGWAGTGPECGTGGETADSSKYTAASEFERMVDTMFGRINTASGPYQMVGILGDGAVLQCAGEDGAEVRAILAWPHPRDPAWRLDGRHGLCTCASAPRPRLYEKCGCD